ncbi:MAG: hypothetical protein AAGH15_25380, partial [Myxococcota bacterium]
MPSSSEQRDRADHVLAALLEPHVAGREILWVGAAGPGPERLARAAAGLRVLDTHGGTRRRRDGLAVSPYRPGRLGFDRGRYELVVVPNLAELDDVEGRLEDFARILDDGLLVAGMPAGSEGEGYDALLGPVAAVFEHVRPFGQAGFAGDAFADLDAKSVDEVLVDGSLAEGRGAPVRRFLAFASMEALPSLPTYALVEGARAGTPAIAPSAEGALRDALARAESRLEQLQRRLVGTETELREARASLQQREADVSAPGDDAEVEQRALEARLRERGARVRMLEAEEARLGLLVRDLAEELEEHRRGRRGGVRGEGVLDLAAAHTEAEFRSDELAARITELEEAASARERALAESSGRARGLSARVAEMAELREIAEARVALMRADLTAAADAKRRLEAELAETRESLELALIQARGAPTLAGHAAPAEGAPTPARLAELVASEKALAERVGALSGQLVAAREQLESAELDRDRARAETLRLTAQLAALETRLSGQRLGFERRIAELVQADPAALGAAPGPFDAELARVRDELAGLRGERAGLRLRVADAEASAALRRSAGRGVDEIAAQLADAQTQLAARDALVTRLQLDLAAEEKATRAAEAGQDRVRDENARLREAVVASSQAVDARDAAEKRATILQQELTAALEAAGAQEVQAERAAELERELADAREQLDASERLAKEVQALRERLQDGERLLALAEEREGATRNALAEARAMLVAL